ncbi:hypothetical protein [Inquilinus sp. CA228]|uniref:hypothetical protein n=1 Tax=Inquilinus sp. CA228 TaxID=3455609 RepID=UPI003F8D4311
MAKPLTEAEHAIRDAAYWTPTKLAQKDESLDSRIDESAEQLREEIAALRRRVEQLEQAHG